MQETGVDGVIELLQQPVDIVLKLVLEVCHADQELSIVCVHPTSATNNLSVTTQVPDYPVYCPAVGE